MKIINNNYFKRFVNNIISLIIFGFVFCLPFLAKAMEPGTLIYRTSSEGKMYGYNQDALIYAEKGIVKNVYSGHVGIYIGQENGVDYIVEALSDGIVKTPVQYFINEANGEKLLGAKIPENLHPLQQIRIVELAKSLVNKKLKYDLDFKKQKGPESGEWTCVGLTEKIYESANISNPNNLGALEYDQNYYAIDITPDGFDNYSVINEAGDCFSRNKEFSKISRQSDLLIPAPELIGYDAGLEYNQERYIFLPYTQFLQPTLKDVPVDIILSSSFSDSAIRGETSKLALIFRWSLINNPLSSIKNLTLKAKNLVLNLKDKIFGSQTGTEIVLGGQDLGQEIKDSPELKATKTTSKKITTKTSAEENLSEEVDQKIPAPLITVRKYVTSSSSVSNSLSDASKKSISSKNSSKLTENKGQSIIGTSSSKVINDKKLTTKSTVIASSAPLVKTSASATSTKSKTATNSVSASSRASSGSSGSSSSSQSSSQPKLAIINKIYSTGNNHWVELYNPNNYDFDLAAAGYRLEKTKTAADPSLIMRLGDPNDGAYPGGTTIKAKGKYLIVKASANSYYRSQAQALATRDDFSWGGSGYTLYLGTDALSSSADSDIVDAVGFGAEATYFRGQNPAPAITENYILNRISSLGSNKDDFNLIPSNDPEIFWATSTASSSLATSTATSTNTSVSTTTASTTASTTPPVATTTPLETSSSTNPVASTTDQIGTTTTITATTTTAICPQNLLINRIYSTGDNDWIELYNSNNFDIDLAISECRLEKTKTAQDPDLILRFGNLDDGYYPGGTVIKAQDRYLIVRDQADDYFRNQADAIATRTEFSWTGSGYTIYLGGGAISSSTDEDVIDYVGFGPDATYYQGPGPAVAITDNYVLNRIFSTKANYFDFNLVQSIDPNISWGGGTSTPPLIIPTSTPALPTSFASPGLTDLWHFDECYGAGRYQVGKWDCAWGLGAGYPIFAGSIKQNLDLNNGAISFYYRKDFDYPALDFQLKDINGQTLRILLNQGMLQLEGLPNSQWRYFDNYLNDDLWHQATLSVNQGSGIWSFYLDGVEKINQNFLASLPREFKDITVTGYSTLIDEIAVWNRFLSAPEVQNNYQTQLPFAPLASRLPQQAPVLKHYWDFQEAQAKPTLSLEASDLVGSSTLILPNTDIWTWRALNNSALVSKWSRDLSANFETPLISEDLSLGFWWHDASYPESSRMSVGLKNSSGEELMTLVPTSFRPAYRFNYISSFFSDGLGTSVPNDGEWHYLAMTYNSYDYQLRLYVDGVEKASIPQVWFREGNNLASIEIKNEIGIAEIDDLGVWEGTLSEQEIQDIFSNNK